MKILFFSDTLQAGGKERRLIELIKGLKKNKDYKSELVLMSHNVHYTEIFSLVDDIHYIVRKSKKDFSVFFKFYSFCKNNKPDIIHCWDSMTTIFVLPACILLNIKLINGMVVDTPVKQNILNKYWFRAKITFPFSDFIVGNSNAGLNAYKAPKRKSICIYNGIDLMRFKHLKDSRLLREEIFGSNSKNLFVSGMVASFGKNKDYETLIKAALILISEKEDISFVLVGDGEDLKRIKSLVPEKFDKRIIFLGKRNDVESIINIFDIGILLTNAKNHGEGISNSILEYMALGKPVIATRGGGTNEIVFDNENGFLINPQDINQLKDKISLLNSNKKLAENLGKNGKSLVKEKFNLSDMTDHYINLYEKIIS